MTSNESKLLHALMEDEIKNMLNQLPKEVSTGITPELVSVILNFSSTISILTLEKYFNIVQSSNVNDVVVPSK